MCSHLSMNPLYCFVDLWCMGYCPTIVCVAPFGVDDNWLKGELLDAKDPTHIFTCIKYNFIVGKHLYQYCCTESQIINKLY